MFCRGRLDVRLALMFYMYVIGLFTNDTKRCHTINDLWACMELNFMSACLM